MSTTVGAPTRVVATEAGGPPALPVSPQHGRECTGLRELRTPVLPHREKCFLVSRCLIYECTFSWRMSGNRRDGLPHSVSPFKGNTVQLSHGSLVQHAAEGRMDAPFTCEWRACRCYPAATEILN